MMRTIQAYEIDHRINLTLYQNKRGTLNIKIEIPIKGTDDNIVIISPPQMSRDSLRSDFDQFVSDSKGLTRNQVYRLFVDRFVDAYV